MFVPTLHVACNFLEFLATVTPSQTLALDFTSSLLFLKVKPSACSRASKQAHGIACLPTWQTAGNLELTWQYPLNKFSFKQKGVVCVNQFQILL